MHNQTVAGRSGTPVVVYDTEVRTGAGWASATRLTVHLDRDEPSELLELAWRSGNGAEAVVAFDSGMRSFLGHRRGTDGAPEEYRGVERGRWWDLAEIEEDCRSYLFATEEDTETDTGTDTGESSGDGRPGARRLRLVLDDGRGPVERVTWRDARGTFASVVLRDRPAVRSCVPVTVKEVVASAEHRAAGEVAGRLLDPGPGKWLAFEPAATLDFVLAEPAAVTAYRLTSGNDYRDRDPRNWRLRGSLDGTTWYVLDTRSDQEFPGRLESREYAVVNSTAYTRYRLDIDVNRGRADETQLTRVELLTTDDARMIGTPVSGLRLDSSGENWQNREYGTNLLTDDAAKWLVFARAAWLEFTLPEPAAVTGYTLTSADDHCARDPKDWVLQGSYDGDYWTTLDQRADETFHERFLVREFTVAHALPYRRYRLHITANAEGAGEIQLNRVQLLVKQDDRSPARRGFSGVLRYGHGPAVGYRGTSVAVETHPRPPAEPGAPARRSSVPGLPQVDWRALPDSWTPDMRQDVIRFRDEALARGVPPEDVEAWLGLARRCVVVSPEVDGPVVGRLGTPVMLPRGVPLPGAPGGQAAEDEDDDLAPEHLIATLDLAAIAEDATNLRLPSDGSLLFFAWPDLDVSTDPTCSGGSVIHVPAGTEVVERDVPYDYPPGDFLADVDFDGELRGELRMKYDLSLPDHEFEDDPIGAAHPHADALREVWRFVRSGTHHYRWSHLQIGGYASDSEGWGDPVRTCAQGPGAEAVYAGRPEAAEEPRYEDWLLLAEWHPRMTGLESVTMFWALREQDLAAQRFDTVRVAMWANP
ncbi:DUF1963 domain-containing protein [Streptomyces sp. NPDC015220]|uniref:DUF1963 domain-containing protein n=1 Tax=Streptomyces sp. NPDC015220 TaxID=3364947 RepID=UPI0036F56A94